MREWAMSQMTVEHCRAAFHPSASFFIFPMTVEHCQAAFRLPASPFILLRQNKGTKQKATPESAPGAMLPIPCVAQSVWALAELATLRQSQALNPARFALLGAARRGNPKAGVVGFATLARDFCLSVRIATCKGQA